MASAALSELAGAWVRARLPFTNGRLLEVQLGAIQLAIVNFRSAQSTDKMESDLLMSRLIDEEYTRHPFYGTRRMVVIISALVGFAVNRKRIQPLMQAMGLQRP